MPLSRTIKNPEWAASLQNLQKPVTNLNQFLREALTSSLTKSSSTTTWFIIVISVPKDFWPKLSSSLIWSIMVNKIGTFANIAHTNFNVRLNCGVTCLEAISVRMAKPRVKKASFAAFVITRPLNKPSTTIYTCWSILVSNQKSVDFAPKPFGLSLLLESTSLYIQVRVGCCLASKNDFSDRCF